MAGKFELYKDTSDEYRFRLKAGNGEIILVSEGYENKGGAETGLIRLKPTHPLTHATSARCQPTTSISSISEPLTIK